MPPLLPKKTKRGSRVKPDNVVIAITLKVDGNVKPGVLMTDRVALVPGTVWVRTHDNAGNEQHLNLPVSEIQLVSIEG